MTCLSYGQNYNIARHGISGTLAGGGQLLSSHSILGDKLVASLAVASYIASTE